MAAPAKPIIILPRDHRYLLLLTQGWIYATPITQNASWS